jgi:RNA polymerase-binding transcription factor DksA
MQDNTSPRSRLEAKRGEALTHLAHLRGDIEIERTAESQESAVNLYMRDNAAKEIEIARAGLAMVDGALARLDAGTYGGCAECGKAIMENRLKAVPETAHCLRCAVAEVLR